MNVQRQSQARRSAVWAAFGDALGFITELGDTERVQYRAGMSTVNHTVPWKRKIGGRIGVSVDLPAGTYSDDTQLRLATSRAIRHDGSFDVAAFAKVELTAWANYALGAGVGSKEAAANLARTSATWYSNFFDNKRSSYFRGGGNGAAMRVQPHVWVARDLGDTAKILRDVIRNSVCTHGHPRGIVGACFHALSLARTMEYGNPVPVEEFEFLILKLRTIEEVVESDGDLRLFWLGPWQQRTGNSFSQGVSETVDEMLADLCHFKGSTFRGLAEQYEESVEKLEAKRPEARGSATKTALLAAFLAARGDVKNPAEAMRISANCLGSDTDSIATMAGALLGACTSRDCDDQIQDRAYIESEANRLCAISMHQDATSFRYPDLRDWKPARAAVDAVSETEAGLFLAGLGALTSIDVRPQHEASGESLRWFELPFGQTILARVRHQPQNNQRSAETLPGSMREKASPPQTTGAASRLPDLFASKAVKATEPSARSAGQVAQSKSLNETLQAVIASGFDPDFIGQTLLAYARSGRTDFVERGIALTATILTAYEARTRRKGS